MVSPDCRQGNMFVQIRALTDLTSVARAKANPAHWLERLAAAAALELRLPAAPAS
jgi:hypothetical protein